MYQSINPLTQIVEKKFKAHSDSSVTKKLELANSEFQRWKQTSFQTRSNLLLKVADLLEHRLIEYSELITMEMGKPISQSKGEIAKCAWVCRYYAENAVDFLKNKKVNSSAQMSQVVYEPLGAIVGIMPWNFPFWQIFRFIAPTLMAGNVALIKHAFNVPRCADAIENLLFDAGYSQGVFQNLFISHNQVENIIASPYIKAVTLTGSNLAGSKVAALAGKYTKKTVLELGGSDPFIVFDDADLNLALEQAVLSRFINNGQSCIAAKRFIVHEKIAREFISNFQSLIENLVVGDAMDVDTFIGPMVSEKALIELKRQVDKSIEMGAVCITGGRVHEEIATIYQPTLLINVPQNSPVWQEEVFGPVVALRVFETDEDAVKMANDTRFGLGASVWTRDIDRAQWVCKNISAGTVAINGMVKSEPGLPFGGINESGYGRELGEFGIFEFVNIKTVSLFA